LHSKPDEKIKYRGGVRLWDILFPKPDMPVGRKVAPIIHFRFAIMVLQPCLIDCICGIPVAFIKALLDRAFIGERIYAQQRSSVWM
jgi:hypothetical protein